MGTTQTLHTSAIIMREEEINFGCDRHGLFENNKGKCAKRQCSSENTHTHTLHIKHRMANLGLNTMATGQMELRVIILIQSGN